MLCFSDEDGSKPHKIIMGYGVTRAYDDLQNAPNSRKYPPVIYAPSAVITSAPMPTRMVRLAGADPSSADTRQATRAM